MKTRRAFFSTFATLAGAAVATPALALRTGKSKSELQQELLDDAVIVYRLQRAPTRRVFRIDIGSMPPDRARAHLERIRSELIQRRVAA
jgi:hypothetical protein